MVVQKRRWWQCLSIRFFKTLTESAVTTYSGRLFQKFTMRSPRKFALTVTRFVVSFLKLQTVPTSSYTGRLIQWKQHSTVYIIYSVQMFVGLNGISTESTIYANDGKSSALSLSSYRRCLNVGTILVALC